MEDNVTLLIEYPGGVRAIVDARRHSRVTRHPWGNRFAFFVFRFTLEGSTGERHPWGNRFAFFVFRFTLEGSTEPEESPPHPPAPSY